jgi:AAA family ATP:ADP antiporter
VSVFWSFMADLFRNEQARRLYGFIAAGGSMGALVGPTVTATLAPAIGPANLLPLSACMLLLAVLCIYRLTGWADRTPGEGGATLRRATDRPIGGGIFAGVILVLKSPYLLGIAIYAVMYSTLSTFLYFEQAYIVSAAIPASGDRTALFAQIDLAVNVLSLLGQLFVVGPLIGGLGVAAALIFLPVIAVLGFFALGLFPTLAVLVVLQVVRRAGEYAITRPAREVLFTVLDREEKYKSKNFVDTVVFRGGDAVSGWLFEGLRIVGLGFSVIAFIGVPIALLWAGTGWLLGRTQEELRTKVEYTRRKDESESAKPGAAQYASVAGGTGDMDGDGQPVVR